MLSSNRAIYAKSKYSTGTYVMYLCTMVTYCIIRFSSKLTNRDSQLYIIWLTIKLKQLFNQLINGYRSGPLIVTGTWQSPAAPPAAISLVTGRLPSFLVNLEKQEAPVILKSGKFFNAATYCTCNNKQYR